MFPLISTIAMGVDYWSDPPPEMHTDNDEVVGCMCKHVDRVRCMQLTSIISYMGMIIRLE